jgi:hypothetical protein
MGVSRTRAASPAGSLSASFSRRAIRTNLTLSGVSPSRRCEDDDNP